MFLERVSVLNQKKKNFQEQHKGKKNNRNLKINSIDFINSMWEGIHLLSSIYVVESAETLRLVSGSIQEDPASLALILKNDN